VAASPAEQAPAGEPVALAWLVKRLDTDLESGLGETEVQRRLQEGRNELPPPPRPSRLQRVLEQAREPMSVLLLVAALVSLIALREPRDALAIMAIVVLNVVVAVAQEEQAATALESLRAAAAPTAKVLREGRPSTIPAADVVTGDLVLLASGDRAAADSWLVEAWSLEVDESLLTGESLPVAKAAASQGDLSLPLADQAWMVHSGTLVTSGSGKGVVMATGPNSAVGRLAGHLGRESPRTPLQKQLAKLSARLGQAAVAIALAVFGLMVARLGTAGGGLEEAFLAAVALAVAAVPEGLPTVVTLSLALGVRRMARQGAIVRNLPAVETLGSTTVLLSDKTGTLTQNRMRLAAVVGSDGNGTPLEQVGGEIRTAVAQVAVLCNDASRDPPQGDPVDIALLQAVTPEEVDRLRRQLPRVESLPFDPQRRMMSTLHRIGDHYLLLTKGAPEAVVESCAWELGSDGVTRPLDQTSRTRLAETVDRLAQGGARVLGMAMRILPEPPSDLASEEAGLVLVGLAVLHDPLRPEAAATVASIGRAGIRLVMVTGDHAGTASAVARDAGLIHDPSEVKTGVDLRREGLPAQLDRVQVFARVDPEQKLQLVEAYRAAGEVVAVTGDGVNDAPALRRADIGVAMGRSGSQVAREAADLVLTDDDLNHVTKAVTEGRSIFHNIRKVVDYLVAGNLSEVTVVVVGLVFFPALGVPLFPLQLLWINLLTDGLPALALGFDRMRAQALTRSLPSGGYQLLSPSRLGMLAARGLTLAAGSVGSLVAVRLLGGDWEEGRTVMFSTLVFSHLLYAYVVRSPFFSNRANPRLAGAVSVGLLLQVATVLGPFADLFDVVAIPGSFWLVALSAGLAPILILAGIEYLRQGGRGTLDPGRLQTDQAS
jgi:Ca2+-transporting ATPase